jgi:hypothetical protein
VFAFANFRQAFKAFFGDGISMDPPCGQHCNPGTGCAHPKCQCQVPSHTCVHVP